MQKDTANETEDTLEKGWFMYLYYTLTILNKIGLE